VKTNLNRAGDGQHCGTLLQINENGTLCIEMDPAGTGADQWEVNTNVQPDWCSKDLNLQHEGQVHQMRLGLQPVGANPVAEMERLKVTVRQNLELEASQDFVFVDVTDGDVVPLGALSQFKDGASIGLQLVDADQGGGKVEEVQGKEEEEGDAAVVPEPQPVEGMRISAMVREEEIGRGVEQYVCVVHVGGRVVECRGGVFCHV
jgi:hypothetical protein